MSYLDSGFDQFLHRKLVNYQPYLEEAVSGNTELVVPPASLDSSSIKSIGLDKLTGGEMVVGGENNILGKITVKDADGTEVAVIDNRGVVSL